MTNHAVVLWLELEPPVDDLAIRPRRDARTVSFGEDVDPIDLNTILQRSWSEYVQALQVQLAWWQLRWPGWRVSLDERYDHTWVNALIRFRADTQAPLAALTPTQREILVGFSDPVSNTYFFGNLHAAGRVTQVIQNPGRCPKEAAAIEAARVRAQGFGFRHATPADVVAPWADIANLQYFGPASASRLMLAERPDLYFILNNASSQRLEIITDHKLPQLLEMPSVARHYERMLDKVYAAPWWKHPPPADPRERLVWDCRVALLDVFAYDEERGTHEPEEAV